ncbi:MAG: HigA family addiction module antitoxin [Nocardioides sp.]|uniref:HigA family addiction module antitoxin n=1 Tax=Nocardioides sp. TaxID=35761 RepID=UPI00238EFD83|nr:HigA family addiction module antitoxin [Nocardioides sp.]MDE0775445.1 HigA family addiction module antitoxin [Nocardioides sp.]
MNQIQTKGTVVPTAPIPGELHTDWGVHPGIFLNRYMQEHGIRQTELAERTGLTSKHVNQIVKQAVGITPDVAVLLETALGTPHRFWSQVGADWDMHLSEQRSAKALQEAVVWVGAFDATTLLRNAVITSTDTMAERARKVLQFFRVATPAAFDATWVQPRTSFKRSQKYTVNGQNTALWLRLVERAAEDLDVPAEYSAANLRKAAAKVPAFTTMPFVTGFEAAQAALAEAGVTLVFVRQVPETRVHGATWWVDGKPVIGITERQRRPDIFWFSVLHEIGHILRHPKRQTFLDLDREKSEAESEQEREANDYAADVLFPKGAKVRIAGAKTKQELMFLAADLNLGVAVVAGQHGHLTGDWRTGGSLRSSLTEEDLVKLEALSAARAN